jgi:hypothetical protein
MGRPPLGAQSRQTITLRLDPSLLDALREIAAQRGIGYQTLIHEFLTQAVSDVPRHDPDNPDVTRAMFERAVPIPDDADDAAITAALELAKRKYQASSGR